MYLIYDIIVAPLLKKWLRFVIISLLLKRHENILTFLQRNSPALKRAVLQTPSAVLSNPREYHGATSFLAALCASKLCIGKCSLCAAYTYISLTCQVQSNLRDKRTDASVLLYLLSREGINP